MSSNSISVIGMGCVFPGALSPNELWENVVSGRRFFRILPSNRLPLDDYYSSDPEEPLKTYSNQIAVIDGWKFDPMKYKIPPVVFNTADIVHWMALWSSEQAIINAKINLDALDKTRIGVVIGNSLTGEFFRTAVLHFRWPYVERILRRTLLSYGMNQQDISSVINSTKEQYKQPLPNITEDSLSGNMSNTIAGRICNYFDLGGGGYTVDGACSSSLLAISKGCESLVNEEVDFVIAGGVDVSLDPFELVGFAKTKALAKTDIHPYDEKAEGMLPGEGCGMVVLTREQFAKNNGYEIHGIIKGWGHSTDGRSSGITAPVAQGQMRAIEKAYKMANFPIGTVDLFEGHGTGTAVGDLVEVTALKTLLDRESDGKLHWLGSIKGNIGHCKAAAGVAGLIKSIMSLKHKIIPPSVSCQVPNKAFGRPLGKLRPTIRGTKWLKTNNEPRRAAVSAMGFGGANSHLILEEVGDGSPSTEDLSYIHSSQSHELICLSETDLNSLNNKLLRLKDIANVISRAELTDLAAAMAKTNQNGKMRVAFVTSSPWDLAAKVEHVLEVIRNKAELESADLSSNGVFAGHPKKHAKIAMLFPGQASQRLNMGEHYIRRFPFVRDFYERVESQIADVIPKRLRSIILVNTYTIDDEQRKLLENEINNTRLAQPSIVSASLAILKILEHYGIAPDISLGHSLGDVSALYASGAYDDVTAVRIAAIRGDIMASMSTAPGSMVAVREDSSTINRLIVESGCVITISNYNSPKQTVVSGLKKEINNFITFLETNRISFTKLKVTNAFHSQYIAPATKPFLQSLNHLNIMEPTGKVISSSTGALYEESDDIRERLSLQIANPVQFIRSIESLKEFDPDMWIEVGPGETLSRLVRDNVPDAACFSTNRGNEDGSQLINNILARAFVLGISIKLNHLFSFRFSRPFDFDNYAPDLITNPCERPISEEETPKLNISGVNASFLKPNDVSDYEFSTYLKSRQNYIKELVELDYKHHTTDFTKEPLLSDLTKDVKIIKSNDDPLEFAVNWIATRTGYSTEAIKPESRLRDDLNLDSIKVGELSIALNQYFESQVEIDPISLSNSTVAEFITAFGADSSRKESEVMTHHDTLTYGVQFIRSSIENEKTLNSFDNTSGIIIPLFLPPVVELLQNRLSGLGAKIELTQPKELADNPVNYDFAIIIVNADNTYFASETGETLLSRIEPLFDTLKAVIGFLKSDLVILELNRESVSQSAGPAMLKTLMLEHNISAKWVSLEKTKNYDNIADILIAEMNTSGNHVAYQYVGNTRLAEIVTPVESEPLSGPLLHNEDVVLVTGGAKGITAELARELAIHTGTKLALIGSSPDQDNDVKHTLKRFREKNINCNYYQCDITRITDVRKMMESVQADLGTISGIFHGAGVSKPKPFSVMLFDDFGHCFRVKALGFYNLIQSVNMDHIKMVHVISSIIGKTGMSGQLDYAYSNAWLDDTVRTVALHYPHLHCLTLGFTVWKETGLGNKLNVIHTLEKLGVTALSTKDGVAAYRRLLRLRITNPAHVIIGNLPQSHRNFIFPLVPLVKGRFIENILHWNPNSSLSMEIVISHQSDQYLREHVYRGTPILPGVIAIEAMTQAVMACKNTTQRPTTICDIAFHRPLIVPKDAKIKSVVEVVFDDSIAYKVTIKHNNTLHFSASFKYLEQYISTKRPAIDGYVEIGPEMYNPIPLFQGKLFRLIQKICKIVPCNSVITEIYVPKHNEISEFISSNIDPRAVTHDAFLQSGALALPAGFLPDRIGQISKVKELTLGDTVICSCNITRIDGLLSANIEVFSTQGELLERIEKVELSAPRNVNTDQVCMYEPGTLKIIHNKARELKSKGIGISIVHHTMNSDDITHISDKELKILRNRVSQKRHVSSLHNIIAAKNAFVLALNTDPGSVYLGHHNDGHPYFYSDSDNHKKSVDNTYVSIADIGQLSLSIVAKTPVGIDIEEVKNRNGHEWYHLLKENGYYAADQLTTITGEPFDYSATRLWTIKESLIKSKIVPPNFQSLRFTLDKGWFTCFYKNENKTYKIESTLVHNGNIQNLYAVTIVYETNEIESVREVILERNVDLRLLIDQFKEKLINAEKAFQEDPIHVLTEINHQTFTDELNNFLTRIEKCTSSIQSNERKSLQHKLYSFMSQYSVTSTIFSRALTKPLGYPGDHLLLNSMFQNKNTSKSLGYHLDRFFLEHNGTEAVRQRTYWVVRELNALVKVKREKDLRIMDLGSGPMSIERTFLQNFNGKLSLVALDFDQKSFDFATPFLPKNADINTEQQNLVSPEGIRRIAELAKNVDAVCMMGLIEYLEDDTVMSILQSLRKNLPKNACLFTSNYLPTHSSRTSMEWFLDWWLVYRSEKQMMKLALASGFTEEQIELFQDPTHSITLMKLVD